MSISGHYPVASGGVSEDAIVLHYRDDGPNGPCGQSNSTTAPWSRLLYYENEADGVAFMRFLEGQYEFAGRRRPRIESWWYGEHVVQGPVVPQGERA